MPQHASSKHKHDGDAKVYKPAQWAYFNTTDEAIAYARNAAFAVYIDKGSATATRNDIDYAEYVLVQTSDRRRPLYFWERVNLNAYGESLTRNVGSANRNMHPDRTNV